MRGKLFFVLFSPEAIPKHPSRANDPNARNDSECWETQTMKIRVEYRVDCSNMKSYDLNKGAYTQQFLFTVLSQSPLSHVSLQKYLPFKLWVC